MLNLWAYVTDKPAYIEMQKNVPCYEKIYYTAEEVYPFMETPVAFAGHNHRARVYEGQGKKIISVGSVGRFGRDMGTCKWVRYRVES